MAWNQPGNENKDPWNPKKKNDGPPDLDEMLKGFLKKIGGGSGSGTSNGGSGGGIGLSAILLVAVIIWGVTGFYTVKEQERGLVLRFGEHVTTQGAGLHWRPNGVDNVILVDVTSIRQFKIKGEMLTQDENIVHVDMGIQYRVNNPADFKFNLTDTEETVPDVTETALRQVIGDSTMDDVLTEGRSLIRSRTLDIITEILDSYKAGISITEVTFETARAPKEVQDAFDDAIKAREDKEKFEETAEAYANKVVPQAEGNAQQVIQASQAYAKKVIADAKGKVALYNKLLPEYMAAPKVTRRRLYLETMEKVLGSVKKVIVDKNNQQVNVMSLDAVLSTTGNSSKRGGDK